MPVRLSRYFKVEPSELTSRGVFDAHLGIDNKLFVDPKLLKKKLKLPEFTGARRDITQYFSKVIKLLKASRKEGDVAWLPAATPGLYRKSRSGNRSHFFFRFS